MDEEHNLFQGWRYCLLNSKGIGDLMINLMRSLVKKCFQILDLNQTLQQVIIKSMER